MLETEELEYQIVPSFFPIPTFDHRVELHHIVDPEERALGICFVQAFIPIVKEGRNPCREPNVADRQVSVAF